MDVLSAQKQVQDMELPVYPLEVPKPESIADFDAQETYFRENKEQILSDLSKHGAVVVRGFDLCKTPGIPPFVFSPCTVPHTHEYKRTQHTYTHTRTHPPTHTHLRTHTHTPTHIHTYTLTHTQIQTYLFVDMCTQSYTCIYAYIPIKIRAMGAMSVRSCTYSRDCNRDSDAQTRQTEQSNELERQITHTHTHTHTQTHTHTRTHTYTHTYTYTYTHTYTHTHTHTIKYGCSRIRIYEEGTQDCGI